ncbi:hypothetical protein [Sandaracinus amylolyticus]|uniref:Uncharacterized protein n=1 Tax=Sandaracinus amylolyticus TaxID=927083 RepID=A0A0F6YGD6_9BACT|nr:hypothetical protein [Sandaracinus amylolyticus]AKF04553.1 hypothetical protein DB32_001702 [Sandaracinus amylolyticus]
MIGRGVIDPALTPLSLEVAALAGSLLVAGAVQRVQPWTEDAEIVV